MDPEAISQAISDAVIVLDEYLGKDSAACLDACDELAGFIEAIESESGHAMAGELGGCWLLAVRNTRAPGSMIFSESMR
jgi:hypothetical protein